MKSSFASILQVAGLAVVAGAIAAFSLVLSVAFVGVCAFLIGLALEG